MKSACSMAGTTPLPASRASPADVAIEAVGVPASFELCTQLVRPGGQRPTDDWRPVVPAAARWRHNQ